MRGKRGAESCHGAAVREGAEDPGPGTGTVATGTACERVGGRTGAVGLAAGGQASSRTGGNPKARGLSSAIVYFPASSEAMS